MLPLISLVTVFALSAQAENAPPKGGAKPAVHAAPPGGGHPGAGAVHSGPGPGAVHSGPGPAAMHQSAVHQGAGPGHGGPNAHAAHGHVQTRNFGGHAYHGRLAWGGGRWHHEVHNGRDGWWWDVGGAWYFYPQQMDGPPTYVSDVEVMDDVANGPADADGYAPPPGAYAPAAAYEPPPPPPPQDPAASAVGGAIVGGLLGGLLTGRPGGVIAGAAAGGVTGAIVGAQAASRPGYYLAQGTCYYRYPSGQYVPADPRACY